jgi:hypothetical protein
MVGRWAIKPAPYGQLLRPSQRLECGAGRHNQVGVRWLKQTREPILHGPISPIAEELDEARGKSEPKGRGRGYVGDAGGTWSLRSRDGIVDDATPELTRYAPTKRAEVAKGA